MSDKETYETGIDGYSAKEVFEAARKSCVGYTYDDLILLPGYIDFSTDDVSLETQFTRKYKIRTPIISSPMDTVTEHKMAISMALMGGIGVIHYNNTIEQQAAEVRKVKRFENGFIIDPITLPEHTIRDVDRIKTERGCSSIPIPWTVLWDPSRRYVEVTRFSYKSRCQVERCHVH